MKRKKTSKRKRRTRKVSLYSALNRRFKESPAIEDQIVRLQESRERYLATVGDRGDEIGTLGDLLGMTDEKKKIAINFSDFYRNSNFIYTRRSLRNLPFNTNKNSTD